MKKLATTIIGIFTIVLLSACVGASADSTITCSNCNKEIPDYSNYCLYCGTKVGSSTTAKDESQESQEKELVSVESITLTPIKNSTNTQIVLKIRNNTDEPKDWISVQVQALDSNNDVITTTEIGVKYLDAGQAANSGNYQLQCTYDKIDKIKVVAYTFGEAVSMGGFVTKDQTRLKKPIVYTIDEIVKEDDIIQYILFIPDYNDFK